jgi:hypothetical protein
LPPLGYAPACRGAAREPFFRIVLIRRRPRVHVAQNRAGQASPYESESKLSHSKLPLGLILFFPGSHDDASLVVGLLRAPPNLTHRRTSASIVHRIESY